MAISPRYPIPKERLRTEIDVQRSRFVTTLQPVSSETEAQAFVAEIKAEFPDANHNCWAYLIGPSGSSDRIGLSDDGEPHGTAGRPMLTAIQHSGLGDIAVVVTRYFGGVKLGKGGMVKAYTNAVKAALDQVERTERVKKVFLQATFAYALLKSFQKQLEEYEVELDSSEYAEDVCCRFSLPEEKKDAFLKMFDNLTSGRGQLTVVE